MKQMITATAVALALMATSASAQERCVRDAERDIVSWADNNSSLLEALWNQYDASANPNAEIVNYNGVAVPLTYALSQEMASFEAGLAHARGREIAEATDCAGALEVALPRAAWDMLRSLGHPILPEPALRIDFEEIRRGNLVGGDQSAPRVVLRTIDEVLNPFRW